jgi:hypothetical protein
MNPRSLEDYLYLKLMKSHAFHRFVRSVYYKINGIDPSTIRHPSSSTGPRFPASDTLFQPTQAQKFKAFRLMFYDEFRSSLGLAKKYER